MFPGCIILKNDPTYLQGVPDLLVLFENKWAALECKASRRAPIRPNQEYYIELLAGMSFAAFIFPDTKDEILHGLQLAFRPRRQTRVPVRE